MPDMRSIVHIINWCGNVKPFVHGTDCSISSGVFCVLGDLKPIRCWVIVYSSEAIKRIRSNSVGKVNKLKYFSSNTKLRHVPIKKPRLTESAKMACLFSCFSAIVLICECRIRVQAVLRSTQRSIIKRNTILWFAGGIQVNMPKAITRVTIRRIFTRSSLGFTS